MLDYWEYWWCDERREPSCLCVAFKWISGSVDEWCTSLGYIGVDYECNVDSMMKFSEKGKWWKSLSMSTWRVQGHLSHLSLYVSGVAVWKVSRSGASVWRVQLSVCVSLFFRERTAGWNYAEKRLWETQTWWILYRDNPRCIWAGVSSPTYALTHQLVMFYKL